MVTFVPGLSLALSAAVAVGRLAQAGTATAPPAVPTPVPTALMSAVASGAAAVRADLPALAQAVAILLIGWTLAVVLARVTRRVLERAGFDARAAGFLGPGADDQPRPVSRWLGQLILYVVLLFTLAAFFEQAGIEALAVPLNSLTAQILAMLPGIVTAVVLTVVAWLAAQGVGFLVRRSALMARVDDRLGPADDAAAAAEEPSVSAGLVLGAQALVYVVFLPAIMQALGLTALTAPLQQTLAAALALVPGLVAAGAILLATWFVARLAGQIALGLTRAIGLDRRAAGYGVRDVRLSTAVASAVSALVAVPGFVLAVNALGVPAISEPINEAMAQIVAAVPSYVVAGTLVAIAVFVGRVAANVTTTVLAGLGLDSVPERLGLRPNAVPGDVALSEVTGLLVQIGIVLSAAIVASEQLGLGAATVVLSNLASLGLHTLTAVLILVAGLYVSILVYRAVVRVVGPQRRPLAMLAQGAVLVFALAVALSEVGVAESIVTLTFMGIVATVAGVAILSLGLGSRDLAGRLMEGVYHQMAQADPAVPAVGAAEQDKDAGPSA